MDTVATAVTTNGYAALSASELLARMTRSDVEAFGELYDRTAALAYRVAHALAGDPAAAVAAVEAAYLDAWRTARDGADGSSVAGWIVRLVEQRARAAAA